jgi:membrane protease YdiL (CAAX protease family)
MQPARATIPLGLLVLALGLRPAPPRLAMDGAADLLLFLVAGTAAAVVEEIEFRVYLRDRLARAFGWGRAARPTAAATSLLFGAGHGHQGALGLVIPVFVGWLLFLIAASPRWGLVHGIVAHAMFHATAFLCVGALGR